MHYPCQSTGCHRRCSVAHRHCCSLCPFGHKRSCNRRQALVQPMMPASQPAPSPPPAASSMPPPSSSSHPPPSQSTGPEPPGHMPVAWLAYWQAGGDRHRTFIVHALQTHDDIRAMWGPYHTSDEIGAIWRSWLDAQYTAAHPDIGDIPGNDDIRAFISMLNRSM